MEEAQRDLYEVNELLKERKEGQTEPRSKLFFAEVRYVVGLFFG